jgi:hypothetical protein
MAIMKITRSCDEKEHKITTIRRKTMVGRKSRRP